MKYLLNEIPVKTTNSFNINNLKIDLDIPDKYSYKEFDVLNSDKVDIKYGKNDSFNTKIGLELSSSLNVDINIKESISLPVIFTYEFDEDNLVDSINIKCLDNVSANIIFKYVSKGNNKNFHHLKQIINVGENSNITITNIN